MLLLVSCWPRSLVKAEIVELPDRDAFVAWLPKLKQRLAGADKHTSSPIVWLDDSEFLGGCDKFLDYSRVKLVGGGAAAAPARPARAVATLKLDPSAAGRKFDFDLLVIGGGSGGLACGKEAAELGANVALLDFVTPSPMGTTWGLGGTCVNVGCIPKKLFHHAALSKELLHDAQDYGWDVKVGKHDWGRLVDGVRDYIKGLNFGYRVQLRDKNVKYLNKLGRFKDAHTVVCRDKKGEEEVVTAARIVVAVGGRPRALDCPGGELAISSDDMFYLDKPPGKTLVVGASYVALECASFLTGLGYDTTVMVRSIFLRGFDQQMADKVAGAMEKLGTRFTRNAVPRRLSRTPDGRIKVEWEGGEDTYDTVLCAIGRDAITKRLELERAGLCANKNGKIDTTYGQTAVPSVFALGDCEEGVPELTSVAIELGRNLARRMFGKETAPVDLHCVPTSVFAGLEYSCVGLSEEAAREQYGDSVDVYHTNFTPIQWTIAKSTREFNQCYVKVVVDTKQDERVLGIHMVSPESSEIVQAYAVPMKMGMKWQDLKEMIGVHPTQGEEICMLSVKKSSKMDADKTGC